MKIKVKIVKRLRVETPAEKLSQQLRFDRLKLIKSYHVITMSHLRQDFFFSKQFSHFSQPSRKVVTNISDIFSQAPPTQILRSSKILFHFQCYVDKIHQSVFLVNIEINYSASLSIV